MMNKSLFNSIIIKEGKQNVRVSHDYSLTMFKIETFE